VLNQYPMSETRLFIYRPDANDIDEIVEQVRARLAGEGANEFLDDIAAFLAGENNHDALSDQASSYNSDNSDEQADSEVDSEYSQAGASDEGLESEQWSDLDDDDDDDDDDDIADEPHVYGGGAGYVGLVNLHAAVVFDTAHCPPLEELPREPNAEECNCAGFGLHPCVLQLWIGDNDPIDFTALHENALETVNNVVRRPNNLSRKALYRKIFANLEFADFEEGQRRKLPNCAVAKVRQMYPSATGDYMGFLDA
jgi:hypothetical protein